MVTRTGVGKIAIAPTDIAISQDITGIVLKGGIIPQFIISAIKLRMSILLAAQRGATIKGITRNDLKQLKMPLPTTSEQRRIVEIIDQADRLRKLRIDADAKVQRILPALFIKMFGDPLTNPMGLPIASLGGTDITEINPKFDRNSYSDDTKVSFVPMADIDHIWGQITGKQVKKLIEVKKGFTVFSNGDVIFAKITPCMQNGKAAIAENLMNGLGFGSTEFHVLRPGEKTTPEWIFALIRMNFFRKHAENSFTGSAGQQRVPLSFMKNYKIPIPPIEKQIKFSKHFKIISKQIEKTKKTEEYLRDLFKIILHRAFIGNLTASWREAHMMELLQEMELQAKALAS